MDDKVLMFKKLKRLTPTKIHCPFCGGTHEWKGSELGDYSRDAGDTDEPYEYDCNYFTIKIWAEEYEDGDVTIDSIVSTKTYWKKYCEITTDFVDLEDILFESEVPLVRFTLPVNILLDNENYDNCENCLFEYQCLIKRNREDESESEEFSRLLDFALEFDREEYFEIFKSDGQNSKKKARSKKECKGTEQLEKHEQQIVENATSNEKDTVKPEEEHEQKIMENAANNKEEVIMKETKKATKATKKTSIKSALYEKSPKENFETLQTWAGKYKPVLKWAVPVAAVYGAYRILNSDEFDFSTNNIAETCEKKLGFKIKALEDKKALKELMVLGGISAGAYGAVKVATSIFGSNTESEREDISVEEVEAGMNQLESVSKKFSWIQPKAEDMIPVALSVLLVYVTLHKPKLPEKTAKKVETLTEDVRIRFGTYSELVKLFVQDKFSIDLAKEEGRKKLRMCAFLAGTLALFAFLYGKKVLNDKNEKEETVDEEINKPVASFVEQAKSILKKMAPTVYTTLITALVSKKILSLELEEADETNSEKAQSGDTESKGEMPETGEEEYENEPSEEE